MTGAVPNLRGPLGLKGPKPEKKRRKSVRKISAKKAAYLASKEREEGKAHMTDVARLPCLVCGAWPVEVHHEGFPRSDMRTLPLCAAHHRREFGPQAYHYNPRAFYAAHGTSEELLARVDAMLRDAEDDALAAWF